MTGVAGLTVHTPLYEGGLLAFGMYRISILSKSICIFLLLTFSQILSLRERILSLREREGKSSYSRLAALRSSAS